jgi:hypothetical protein
VHQFQTHDARSHRAGSLERPGLVIEMNSLARAREGREDRPLKCVASRHLAGGCSCRAMVPAAVAEAAWARTRALDDDRTPDGFFSFTWQGEAWLAFGLEDGEVRGVFCPTHRAEREALTARNA